MQWAILVSILAYTATFALLAWLRPRSLFDDTGHPRSFGIKNEETLFTLPAISFVVGTLAFLLTAFIVPSLSKQTVYVDPLEDFMHIENKTSTAPMNAAVEPNIFSEPSVVQSRPMWRNAMEANARFQQNPINIQNVVPGMQKEGNVGQPNRGMEGQENFQIRRFNPVTGRPYDVPRLYDPRTKQEFAIRRGAVPPKAPFAIPGRPTQLIRGQRDDARQSKIRMDEAPAPPPPVINPSETEYFTAPSQFAPTDNRLFGFGVGPAINTENISVEPLEYINMGEPLVYVEPINE